MKKKILILASAIVIMLIALGVLWHVYVRVAAAPTKFYHSDTYHYSLRYPVTLTVRKTEEGQNARTVVFEGPLGQFGFEIFIVPHADDYVSDERFRLDQPSGVRNNLAATTIAGATASTFYGFNTAIGETYEVWILHGGYLYEIATAKRLETWLNTILATMKFDK